MRFNSRMDGITCALLVSFITLLFYGAYQALRHQNPIGKFLVVPILLLFNAFVTWSMFSTYYVIEKDILFIHSGPFKWKVPLLSIKTIEKSFDLLASPALSLRRLRISYKDKMVLISPKDQDIFIQLLKEKNPDVRIVN